jgi:hypothetical protein
MALQNDRNRSPRGYDTFFIDPDPILLCQPTWRRGPSGEWEMHAIMETAHLKAARTEKTKKFSRSDFALYLGDFDPAPPVEGQSCRLEMRGLKTYGGGKDGLISRPGTRERRLGRARQKVSKQGQSYLYAEIPSKNLTCILRELEDTAGRLKRVAVIIRPMPRPKKPQPQQPQRPWPPPEAETDPYFWLDYRPPRPPEPKWAIILAIPKQSDLRQHLAECRRATIVE